MWFSDGADTPYTMGEDQFGIHSTLQHMIDLMAHLAALGVAACIALVVLGVVTVARGRAEEWTKQRPD
jgi:hypothetical protein